MHLKHCLRLLVCSMNFPSSHSRHVPSCPATVHGASTDVPNRQTDGAEDAAPGQRRCSCRSLTCGTLPAADAPTAVLLWLPAGHAPHSSAANHSRPPDEEQEDLKGDRILQITDPPVDFQTGIHLNFKHYSVCEKVTCPDMLE